MRHCPTAITDNKEVVMVNPVTNEDVDEDTEDPESEERKDGEMEVTDSPDLKTRNRKITMSGRVN